MLLSDTHGHHDKVDVPSGDVLLFGGDLTNFGSQTDVARFDEWLAGLPHRHKFVIAGNHDYPFENDANLLRHATYLQDQLVEVEGLSIYGSPWQPIFCRMAFNLSGPQLRERWSQIPQQLDILITHGPPRGVLDCTSRGVRVGCEELAQRVAQIRPKIHLFGHIHEGYGQQELDGVHYCNASICDLGMRPNNRPIVVDWDASTAGAAASLTWH